MNDKRMKVNIKRTRYIIVRDKKEVFCGIAQNYKFKEIDNLGDTAIKTYLSENKARASFISSWYGAEKLIDSGRIEFIKVIEAISGVEE